MKEEAQLNQQMAGIRLSDEANLKGVRTRGGLKRNEKDRAFKKLGQDADFQSQLHKDMELNDTIKNESFFGIYKLLSETEERKMIPIIFIIKNIKQVPQGVLNDLIHHLKKYRDMPYELRLNLMIGIQNNNVDEFAIRVRISNAVKMTVKRFYFPCMRNIIYEVISGLIMTATSLTLDQTFISKIVEISNIHGMSIKKFKRIMKIIISDFFFSNEFFFIHYVDIGLESYEEFVKSL
jgi:hypothetical protein